MHEVLEEGMKEVRMIRNEEWFVSYAIGGLVHEHTGEHPDIQAVQGSC